MNKSEITKNLKQIKQLLEEDAPMIAKERIGFLINDIENERMYRGSQGKSLRQQENNEKMMFYSAMGLLATIVGIIIYGLISG